MSTIKRIVAERKIFFRAYLQLLKQQGLSDVGVILYLNRPPGECNFTEDARERASLIIESWEFTNWQETSYSSINRAQTVEEIENLTSKYLLNGIKHILDRYTHKMFGYE